MKDLKITLKAAKRLWKEWCRVLWKPYLLLALTATLLVVALLMVGRETLLPLWIYSHETSDWDLILRLVGIDVAWTVVCFVAFVATVWSSVVAHRAMRMKVSAFPSKDLGRGHRNRLLAMSFLLMGTALLVGFLPSLVLCLSVLAGSRSGLMLDAVPTPTWAWVALVVCTALGMLLCEVAMTFVRLMFHDVPATDPATQTEEETVANAPTDITDKEKNEQ